MLILYRARQELPVDFKEMFAPVAGRATKQHLSKVFDTEVEVTTNGIRTVHRYLVHHSMSSSSGDKELDQWARERKLYAWVAVAAPIKVSYGLLQLQSSWNNVQNLSVRLIVHYVTYQY